MSSIHHSPFTIRTFVVQLELRLRVGGRKTAQPVKRRERKRYAETPSLKSLYFVPRAAAHCFLLAFSPFLAVGRQPVPLLEQVKHAERFWVLFFFCGFLGGHSIPPPARCNRLTARGWLGFCSGQPPAPSSSPSPFPSPATSVRYTDTDLISYRRCSPSLSAPIPTST